MKLKNIFMAGAAAMMLASCNDYLDVDAPSSYTEEFVFSQKSEISNALNGVYAKAIVGDLYGGKYQTTFILNSDVDISISSNKSHAHNTHARLDCDDQSNDIYKYWTASYTLIEYANRFIESAEKSEFYASKDADVLQYVGEAKCLRAMAYHDLVVMFGDVPFTFQSTASKGNDFILPVTDRQVIQDSLIADLEKIAPYMRSTSNTTVERCSKEFAQAMIARIALTAGGYSLRPDKSDAKNYGTMQRPSNYLDYYKKVLQYTDSVILSGKHHFGQTYQEVFVNECNYKLVNDDDVIFEFPFAKNSTGTTGYSQGPTYNSYESNTVGPWGECKGNQRLNAFYRFLFKEGDKRCEFVNGLWYYSYYTNAAGALADSVYIRADYSVHNNKWSKLWTDESLALGTATTDGTGINFPYMRYADVLLMNAEADNEINDGPTVSALANMYVVRARAFSNTEDITDFDASSKEAFQKSILRERMYEFAGENSRWRDLVRTNTYGEELVYSFLRYYSAGMQAESSMTGFEDAISEHDSYGREDYINQLPNTIFYHAYTIDEPTTLALRGFAAQLYGYDVENGEVIQKYPNQSRKSLRIFNAYKPGTSPATSLIKNFGFTAAGWLSADFYQWGNGDGTPRDQCKYSFYGYIRCDDAGNVYLVDNGTLKTFPTEIPEASKLPVVRYILPYPNLAIQRSSGAYKNYYGY